MKWKMSDKSKWKKESKRKNILIKCFKRTKKTSKDKKMTRRIKDLQIWMLKKSILECLKSKKPTVNKRWNNVKQELKNLWIRWLIMFWIKWIKSKSLKMICFWDTKMKKNRDRDKLMKEDWLDKSKIKRIWEIS